MMYQEHTIEVENYTFEGEVTYRIEDDSFDHAFGTEKRFSAVAEFVQINDVYKDGELISTEEVPPEIAKEAERKFMDAEYTGEFPDPSDEYDEDERFED